MFPEDRVLVGVINRKRDLAIAQAEGWYRIPQRRMPRGVNAEYVAFFLSRAFKEQNGGVYYYAEFKGLDAMKTILLTFKGWYTTPQLMKAYEKKMKAGKG